MYISKVCVCVCVYICAHVCVYIHISAILVVAFNRSFTNSSPLCSQIQFSPFSLALFMGFSGCARYLRIASAHLFLCRVNDREAALEETYRLLQQFPLDLEKFLAWLTEAETTANVLQDATHKERLLEDSKGVRELMKQWQVSLLQRSCESTPTSLSICPCDWYAGDKRWPDFFKHLGKKESGRGRGTTHLLSFLTADLLNSACL